ncbi:MAG: carboxymuconolactone decarboxylase family protein [Acholeplasmataceae bacterium]
MNKQDQKYFKVKTFNHTLFDAMYMMAKYRKEMKSISKIFRSNIMMAVTNVNGCRLCSYYHTSELIKSGVPQEELNAVLLDDYNQLDSEQTMALVFAQHYADVDGAYDKDAFEKLKDFYGYEKAIGILASIKVIMFGNMNGISLGNIWDRLRFKKAYNAKILTDLFNGLFAYLLIPIYLFINLFRRKKTY